MVGYEIDPQLRRARQAADDAMAKAIEVDASKANASTVGGLSTRLNAAEQNIAGKAPQSALDALALTIPIPSAIAPKAEANAATPGAPPNMKVAKDDHQHPRLTSTTYGTLGSNGLSSQITFPRTFAAEPGVVLTPVTPGGTQPVALQVDSWVRATMTPTPSGDYIGCIVKGYRAQPLPNLNSVSGVLTAVITGVNAIVTALANFNVFGGSVNGVRFSCIAVQRSDV